MSVRPDLQVSVATAQAIIDGVLMGHTVAAVSKVHGGEIAAVYEIAFGDTDQPVVLKVYPDFLHWKMQKEVTVASLIQARLSVPAPRILLADDSKSLLGLNFILMTKLAGSILRRLEPSLTQDQLASAYRQIGRLLREFHRIPMDAFGYIGASGISTAHLTNHDYLSCQFDRKLKEFADRGGAASLAQRVAAYFLKRAYLLHECSRPVLCHNDLHTGNLLAQVKEGGVRLSGVLDFEGALAGDPLMDVAKALYYLNAEARNAVLEGYGDTDDSTGRRRWSFITSILYSSFGVGWPKPETTNCSTNLPWTWSIFRRFSAAVNSTECRFGSIAPFCSRALTPGLPENRTYMLTPEWR
jgi:hygromycin-B 7''-O-kinase